MSAQPGQLQEEPQQQQPTERRSRRETARTVALVVLAVLVTVFAFLNLKEVKVNWIIGSGKAPLIIVIVVSLLLGIVLSYFSKRISRKRR
ncbi:MAG: hypothetical protein JWO23_53 [Solirubrobacterales bacterium]|jgi:uncharacterized integral membrane protein|nr:hypothetical protein [Solirubrobacterales bacterium]MCW3026429.1 hypothetical protein [Solirubrobacterales bacterium]